MRSAVPFRSGNYTSPLNEAINGGLGTQKSCNKNRIIDDGTEVFPKKYFEKNIFQNSIRLASAVTIGAKTTSSAYTASNGDDLNSIEDSNRRTSSTVTG